MNGVGHKGSLVILVMFYVLIWVLFGRIYSFCEDSLSCTLSMQYFLYIGYNSFGPSWRKII